MSGLVAGILIFWVPLAVVVGRRFGMMMRHIDYLQSEVRALGGQDMWAVRCTHCGKRMREAPSIRLATRYEGQRGGWERTDGVFHTDRLECSRAADAMQEAR